MSMTLDRRHYVNLRNGRFDSTGRDDLDALFEALAQDDDRQRLVVHVHGGLVSESRAVAGAERLLPVYREAGAYPVFLVWESGLLETLRNNLGDVAADKLFRRLRERLISLALGKLGQREGERGLGVQLPDPAGVRAELKTAEEGSEPFAGVAEQREHDDVQLSKAEEDQARQVLEEDGPLQAQAEAVARAVLGDGAADAEARSVGAVEADERGAQLLQDDVKREIEAEAGPPGARSLITTAWLVKRGVAVLRRVLQRTSAGRAHGLYPTVVEEIMRELFIDRAGGLLWRQMKKDTADAFGGDPAQFGGTALLQGLAARANGEGERTILVGHSAGSVSICNLISHADAALPPGVKFDVILLAPACTFSLFADTLEQHGDRIANLRMFAMSDELERTDRMLPPLYTRSLLYLVSGLLEDEPDMPIVGMKRFYEGDQFGEAQEKVDAVRSYLAERPSVWSSVSGGPGLASAAASHGAFDEDDATLRSVQHLIRSGFAA
jgi:hypothetical protein